MGLVVAGWLYLEQTNSVLGQGDIAKMEPLAEKASANGLIIPGYPGPASDVINAPADRSATASFSPEVQAIVDRLRAAHDQDMAPDDLFWLITAELASDDLVMARHYLERVLAKDDLRFPKLEAILEYRENQVGKAEDILRGVLGQAPGDNEAMFNLGQVLIETGRNDEGTALLLSVQDSPDSEIANRARAALDSLSARQRQP